MTQKLVATALEGLRTPLTGGVNDKRIYKEFHLVGHEALDTPLKNAAKQC